MFTYLFSVCMHVYLKIFLGTTDAYNIKKFYLKHIQSLNAQ